MDAWSQILLPDLWGRLSRLKVNLNAANPGATQAWQNLAISTSMSLRKLSVSFEALDAQIGHETEGSAIISRLIRLAPEIQTIQVVNVPLEAELISAISFRSKCTRLRLLQRITTQPELATCAPLVNARSLRHFTFGYGRSTQHPTHRYSPVCLSVSSCWTYTKSRTCAALLPSLLCTTLHDFLQTKTGARG